MVGRTGETGGRGEGAAAGAAAAVGCAIRGSVVLGAGELGGRSAPNEGTGIAGSVTGSGARGRGAGARGGGSGGRGGGATGMATTGAGACGGSETGAGRATTGRTRVAGSLLVVRAALSISAVLRTAKTEEQTWQRARTPAAGTLAGSTL